MVHFTPINRGLRHASQNAFTIIELLIVVSIIVVLVAILLPTLTKARQAAQGATCLANLRTLGTAEYIYSTQNKGKITTDMLPSSTGELENALNMQSGYSRIVFCPALFGQGAASDIDGLTVSAYGINEWIFYIRNTLKRSVRITDIRNSAETVLFGDTRIANATGLSFSGNGVPNSDTFFSDPYRGYENSGGTIVCLRPNFQGRHNGLGSVLWMDGHATLERPTPVPSGTPTNAYNPMYCQNTPSFYSNFHIGYLVRKPSDLNSIAGEYFFVFRKDLLDQNSLPAYQSSGAWH